MSQIFYAPNFVPVSSAGSLLAGAKLFFWIVGTNTPQDTYSDWSLSVPNTNPLIADANGVFPVAFLKYTPRYTVRLETSAGVFMRQQDDIGPDSIFTLGAASLASANVFTGTSQKLSAAEVRLLFDETDAGVDKRLWDLDIDGAVLKLRTRTDADGAGVTFLTGTRGATTAITSINLTQTWQYNGNEIASQQSGSFTATLTGMTAGTTGTVKYRIAGNLCMLYIEANITGTSNTTAMTLTGLPAACQPAGAAQHKAMAINVTDNGNSLVGEAFIDGTGGGSPGTITFGLYSTTAITNRLQGGAVFTNSGTKGLANGFQMIYSL